MTSIFRQLTKELTSITTLLFLVAPFVMHMASSPDTGNSTIDSMKNNISAVTNMVDVDHVKSSINQSINSIRTLAVAPAKLNYGGSAHTRSSRTTRSRGGHYAVNNGPIFIPRS